MSSNPTGGRVILAGALLALLIAACGASATPVPSAAPATSAATAAPATNAPAQPTAAPAVTPEPTGAPAETPEATSGSGVSDPIGALADLTSYKLKMAITAANVTGGLGALGNIGMDGTVILKPEKAADMQLSMGSGAPAFHVVEVGGKQYVDIGTGLIPSTDPSQSSMVDSLSPEKMFGSFGSFASQMQVVGDETKNGVATTHLKAGSDILATLGSSLGSTFGIPDGNWTMDVWVAKDGGYAVSWVMKGTGTGGAEAGISLDLTNVNDPANTVKGP